MKYTGLSLATFCHNFKGGFVVTNLMNASNLEFISAQSKSRLVKIISYLSKGEYRNYFNPGIVNENLVRRALEKSEGLKTDGYIPSFSQENNGIKRRSTPNDSRLLIYNKSH